MDTWLAIPIRRSFALLPALLAVALTILTGCADSNGSSEVAAGTDTTSAETTPSVAPSTDAAESGDAPVDGAVLIAEAARRAETEWAAREPLLVAATCGGVSVVVDPARPGDCDSVPEGESATVQCPATEASTLPISVSCLITSSIDGDDSTVNIEITSAEPLEFTTTLRDATTESTAGRAVLAVNDRLGTELGLGLDGICEQPESATAVSVACRAVTDDGRTVDVAAIVEGTSIDDVGLRTSGVLGASELRQLESDIAMEIEAKTGASPRVSCGTDLVFVEEPTTLSCGLSGPTTVTGAVAAVVLSGDAPLQVTWEGVATTALTDPIARLAESALQPAFGEVVATCPALFELLPGDMISCTAMAGGQNLEIIATVLDDGSFDVRTVGVIDESQRATLIADAEASITAISLSSFMLDCPPAPMILDENRQLQCELNDEVGTPIDRSTVTLQLDRDAPTLAGWELSGVDTGLQNFAETAVMDDAANNYGVTITERDCSDAGTDDSGLFECTGHLVTDRIPSNFDLEFVGVIADGEIRLSRVNLLLPADITVIDADAAVRLSERLGTRVTVTCDMPTEPVPSRIPIPPRDCELLVTECEVIATLADFTSRQRDAAEAECASLGAGSLPAKVWIEFVANDLEYQISF